MSEFYQSAWSVRRIIPSDKSLANELASQAAEVMLARQWPARDVYHVQLAFEEAVANAVSHGNQFDPNKNVEVEIHCSFDRVYIRIVDQGPGFDPAKIPDPRDRDLMEVGGGRGLLLIRKLMSGVVYNEKGTQIEMTKIKGEYPLDEDDDDDDDDESASDEED